MRLCTWNRFVHHYDPIQLTRLAEIQHLRLDAFETTHRVAGCWHEDQAEVAGPGSSSRESDRLEQLALLRSIFQLNRNHEVS